MQISKIFCIFVKIKHYEESKMHLSLLIIMLLIGFGISFLKLNLILIYVYTICIAFFIIYYNTHDYRQFKRRLIKIKNMIKITGRDYEVYVNKNKMINIYYEKKEEQYI